MLRNILFALALALLMAAPALAAEGTGTIYGVVECQGTVIPDALVTAVGDASFTSRSVRTNDKGVYIIDKLPADEYIVETFGAPKGAYKPSQRNVFLWRKTTKEINFKLDRY